MQNTIFDESGSPIGTVGDMADYKILIGPPGPNFGWGTVQALLACFNSKHEVQFVTSGNGFDDFDAVWTSALNASEAGRITHFAMLHLDVIPLIREGELWLDILVAEMARLGLDMISAAVPLKDLTGITSSGIGDPKDPWHPYRRFTMRELFALPETFTAADAGYAGWPLLHNTGCWLADLRSPVFHQADADGTCRAHFAFPERVYRDPVTGLWAHARESEDWFFSRCLHSLGAKTAITRKVQLNHLGKAGFRNFMPWGQCEHDDATAGKWNVPRGPWDEIQGWFDFADIYAEQVAKVNGKPAHFVEVGSWLGKSTAFMASAIRDSGKQIRFDAVDNWQGGTPAKNVNGIASSQRVAKSGRDLYAEFSTNLRRCNLLEFVHPRRSDSAEAATTHKDASLDFVFIDADHSYDEVSRDLAAWWPKVRKGGTLAGHDFNEPEVQKAANEFFEKRQQPITKRGRCFVAEVPT